MHLWIFGYGSLIWRPDMPFRQRRPARLHGWLRRFWQGSHDHRGLPHQPGRVVTLLPEPAGYCDGMAYQIAAGNADETFRDLAIREKNGYDRYDVPLTFLDTNDTVEGLVYIAPQNNFAFLGPAPLVDMVEQISQCEGPSGSNRDYLFSLADALRSQGAHDPHVFELEAAVRREV